MGSESAQRLAGIEVWVPSGPSDTMTYRMGNSFQLFTGQFMRNLAILGLVAMELMVVGCGSSNSTTSTSNAANGIWESALVGSDAGVGVFNFTTSFTVGGSGSLSVTYFSFLTTGPCFPLTGETTSGSFDVTSTGTTPAADFQFTVQSGGSTLSLTGTATGTTDSSGNTTWKSITGTWTETGGTNCGGSGTFTMTQTGV
jgi:hypothetical protein